MKNRILGIVCFVAALLAFALFAKPEASTPVAAQEPFRVIGYVTSWSGSLNEVNFDQLTHVNYAFLLPSDSGDGSLKPLDNPAKLQQLVSIAHANNVKVLISVGGWNDGNDQGFETLAANANTRATFVNNMVNFVNTYNLDGVDIDWEYPDPGTSGDNYTLLMSELSTAMHSRGKLLTAAVVALGYTGGGVSDEVFGYVDYIMPMAYDGGSGATHSPYSYAVDSLAYWRGRGLPQSKTVLGVPFYGRPTWASYRSLVANDPQAPYKDTSVYNGTTTYYNGIQTIQDKTSLALQETSGVMIWEMSQDTLDNTSLLRAITEVVSGGPLPTVVPPTPTNTPAPGDCVYAPWQADVVYVGGDRVTHNNHEWEAKWWTLGDEPGANQQYVWQDLGECGGVVTPPPPTNTPPGPTNTPQPPTATPPNPTATPDNPSGTWTAGTYYATGELVQYNGQTYRCRQSHTAYTGWEPPNVPALWELVN